MKKLLIVDDEEDIREVAQLSMEVGTDWDLSFAHNGSDALEAVVKNRPDGILMDVMMPDMDGPTTVKKLKANESTRDIPVILLTAKVQAKEQKVFSELDVLGVLHKPFDPMELPRMIAELFGWQLSD